MGSTDPTSNLPMLFAELKRCDQNAEYEKALKICEKILQIEPENVKALHCSVVCKINNGQFADALKIIERSNIKDLVTLEKAYCQYRLNDIKECLETLKNVAEPTIQMKELMAQALYRLERYQECYDLYVELIKNSEDEYDDERETNLSAVVACMSSDSFKNEQMPELSEHTYELCYNKACINLGRNEYDVALNKLKAAEDMCRKTLVEEGCTEEEIEAELGLIKTQMGYAHQKLGKENIALKTYTQVLKQKPSDLTVVAVASSNIVAIHKDQNIFDSKKKIKAALNELLETKLNSCQRKAINFNHCLLLMQTNQSEPCRKQLHILKEKFPAAIEDATKLEAALLCKEKKFDEAIEVLKNALAQKTSVELVLVLGQVLLNQNRVNEALRILEDLYKQTANLGVVSAIVSLYLSLEDKEAAINILKKAVEQIKQNQPSGSKLIVLYRETAKLLCQLGKSDEAIRLLEELRRLYPQNHKILAQLVSAYSQTDPEKAKKVSEDLPPIEKQVSTADIDTLESSNWSLGAKYVKKTTKADPSPAVKSQSHKKKKKKKLPKNCDPNVDPDPERWLPRWQRSTFKRKKDKRNTASVGKGTQGAVEGDPNIKPQAKVVTASQPAPQGPRQQRGAQKKKKKSSRR